MAVRGDELLAGRRRHQPVGLQEFYHQLIETAGSSMQQACPVLGRILWTASGINDAVFLPAVRELSYSPLITNGYRHRSEPRSCRFRRGTKNLRDRFAIEPGISFDKGVEKIFAQFGFRKVRATSSFRCWI